MTLATSLSTTDSDGSNARHAVGVHTVLIRDDGRILPAKRSASLKLAPGCWSTICGNLEAEESVVAGAARELREETGVEVDPADLSFATITHFVNDQGFGPAFAVFFTATAWSGTPQIVEPDKCDQLGWFAPDQLPAPIVPYVANALADVQHGRKSGGLATAFSVFGWDDYLPRMEG